MGWHSAFSSLSAKLAAQPVTRGISLGIGFCGSLVLGASGASGDSSRSVMVSAMLNAGQQTELVSPVEQRLGRQIMNRSVEAIERTSDQLYLAQSPTPPFALDGKPVYVLRRGKWLEATLQSYQWNSRVGFRYTVEYTAPGRVIEKAVPPHRIRSLNQARNSGISTHSYDLSTQTAIAEMLQAHNTWRQRYGVPALVWSPQLATYAQEWANVLVQERSLRHRQQDKYGENLASASGKQLSPTTVVRLWGEEDKYYNYSTNTCQKGQMCGHYTQLVWRNTREVGCAMARNSQREVWVCNYNPPGNYVGQRPY